MDQVGSQAGKNVPDPAGIECGLYSMDTWVFGRYHSSPNGGPYVWLPGHWMGTTNLGFCGPTAAVFEPDAAES